jgi:hypothetical protein
MRATLLLLATAALAAAAPPPALLVIDPVTPPAPMPGPAAEVRLGPGRFELLKIDGYAGKVAWRSSGPAAVVERLPARSKVWFVAPVAGETVDVAGPVKVCLGLKAGAGGPTRHDIGDEPSVLVRPGPAGEATVEALGVDADGYPYTILSVRVRSGAAPQPPPPGPTPPGPDGTSPFPEPGLRVLMTFDSTNTTRPAAQNSVLYGRAVTDYLKARCVTETGAEATTDGKGYRIYPADVDVSRARPTWANAFRLAQAKGKDWILVGDGVRGYSGPLPATEAEALALLKRFGGD